MHFSHWNVHGVDSGYGIVSDPVWHMPRRSIVDTVLVRRLAAILTLPAYTTYMQIHTSAA